MAIPSKLYKYQAIDNRSKPEDSRSLENLRKHQIWLTNPIHFNDPFDCSVPFSIAKPSDDEWELFVKFLESNEQFRDGLGTQVSAIIFDENHQLTDGSKEILFIAANRAGRKWAETPKPFGVACFTVKPDNLLMWSHYADKHQGFCLEFDTGKDPFINRREWIYSVNYSDLYPRLSLRDIFPEPPPTIYSAMSILTTKSTCWSYEQEWRLLDMQGDHRLEYEPKALTSVYFGWKMSQQDRELVEQALAEGGFTGTKYQMRQSKKREFGLSSP